VPGTDICLRKGWEVHIVAAGIHMDPDIYPDPERFDPDRFSKEERAKRPRMSFQECATGGF
jgi:cytochrome P450 family 6